MGIVLITTSDSLAFLKQLDQYSNDILYCDPPYALGSEVIIRSDGKVDYKNASDFMNKWEMPTGVYWEAWFKEAYRTLKHGGYLIMFGMDRQLLLFKYYAQLSGFQEQQSLYWYFISNFPKATDLSKMIDKSLGEEREVIGKNPNGYGKNNGNSLTHTLEAHPDITAPSSDLAKKYDGYKYSISPLKQTNETIMVFKKPTKTGSVLHDTLAYENGDLTISVGALNIDGNRVGISGGGGKGASSNFWGTDGNTDLKESDDGRYPSQTFIDSQVAEVLDRQSGVSKGSTGVLTSKSGSIYGGGSGLPSHTSEYNYDDIGGCSKILHKCDYEQEDYDLYHYEPKVSSSERNAGCDGFEEVQANNWNPSGIGKQRIDAGLGMKRNNHPTLKPIALNEKILKLFKTPNEQRICYAFAGAGSEIIGGIKAGFDNWIGCEISQEYVDIANARIKYWKETMTTQLDIFEVLGL